MVARSPWKYVRSAGSRSPAQRSRGDERIRVRVAHPGHIVAHVDDQGQLSLPPDSLIGMQQTADRFPRRSRLLVGANPGSIRLSRPNQRCLDAVEKRVNLVFVITASSESGPSIPRRR